MRSCFMAIASLFAGMAWVIVTKASGIWLPVTGYRLMLTAVSCVLSISVAGVSEEHAYRQSMESGNDARAILPRSELRRRHWRGYRKYTILS